ncbi:MAG: toll/interleukin-1 receptor domain-containing protein, partial [Bacteroidales bacterium]|nr:toll/interleukin-1 receptor domain-containing protein [Bacteroidales bacterium]
MSGENFDIFISYRRSDGQDKARMITETLKGKNYRCFLDFDRLKGGKFDDKIYQAIKDAPIFIAVMTPDYLVRQKKDKEEENQNEDWVYKEIEFAKENGKYIITINYNKQIESIPNEVPANISQALGAHTFAEVHDGQTYESNMENLIKGWISEVLPPPSFRSEEKANIEVFSDCDCNILKANEVIATVSKQGYNIIKLRQGRHRLICQSSQFSDIKQEQILTVNESLADDFFDITLAEQIEKRKNADKPIPTPEPAKFKEYKLLKTLEGHSDWVNS